MRIPWGHLRNLSCWWHHNFNSNQPRYDSSLAWLQVLRPNFFRNFKLAQARWLFAMRAKKTSKPELEEGLEKLSWSCSWLKNFGHWAKTSVNSGVPSLAHSSQLQQTVMQCDRRRDRLGERAHPPPTRTQSVFVILYAKFSLLEDQV